MFLLGSTMSDLPDPRWKALPALFPGTICGAFADPSEDPGTLYPEEAELVSRAVSARRHDFALGRWCARCALAQLGVSAAAIPVAPNRAPRWPAGVVGSITHCSGFVGAVVASADRVISIGFDAEPATPLGQDLIRLICTPAEIRWLATAPPTLAADWPKVIFSAKESIHKAISPLCGIMLDFREVTLALDPTGAAFSARLNERDARGLPDFTTLAVRFAVTADHVFTSAFIERPPP